MLSQGIIDLAGTQTFAKEPLSGKIIAGTKADARAATMKKFISFSRMSVTASLLHFGCFAARLLVNGCFLIA